MSLEHQAQGFAVHTAAGALALDAPLGSASRPTWRGLVHTLALLAAIPLLVTLSIVSDGARARAAVIVYAVGLCSMLAVSSVYHRWVHSLRARAIWQRAGVLPVVLLLVGGVTYTVGALCFAFRWPTLKPAVFSYHEVWHVFTIAAAGLHLAAVWTLAT